MYDKFFESSSSQSYHAGRYLLDEDFLPYLALYDAAVGVSSVWCRLSSSISLANSGHLYACFSISLTSLSRFWMSDVD